MRRRRRESTRRRGESRRDGCMHLVSNLQQLDERSTLVVRDVFRVRHEPLQHRLPRAQALLAAPEPSVQVRRERARCGRVDVRHRRPWKRRIETSVFRLFEPPACLLDLSAFVLLEHLHDDLVLRLPCVRRRRRRRLSAHRGEVWHRRRCRCCPRWWRCSTPSCLRHRWHRCRVRRRLDDWRQLPGVSFVKRSVNIASVRCCAAATVAAVSAA